MTTLDRDVSGPSSRDQGRLGGPDTRTYWHGGIHGLEVGDLLLPASEHAAPAPVTVDSSLRPMYLSTRVYVTTDRDLALMYAARYPQRLRGTLYQVTPTPPIDPDPEWYDRPPLTWWAQWERAARKRTQGPRAWLRDDCTLFECPRAEVVAVHPVTAAERQKITATIDRIERFQRSRKARSLITQATA